MIDDDIMTGYCGEESSSCPLCRAVYIRKGINDIL